MTTQTTHYETLRIPTTADATVIKKAYRKLALESHPDRNPEKSDDDFKKISEAYSVLSDPEKKRAYDNPIQNLFPMFSSAFYPPMDPTASTNFFANFFGGGEQQEQSHTQQPTPNINHRVTMTLEDFYTGKTCKFAISRKVQCKECNGEGGSGKKEVCCIGCDGVGVRVSTRGYNSVSKSPCIQCRGKKVKVVFDKVCRKCNTLGVVPQRVVAEAKFEAGSRPGDRVVLKNMSDCLQGRPPGDVIVTASEKSHRIYKRSSKSKPHDLKCYIDISLRQSLCGFTAEITHLDGRIVEVKSDAVTPHGHKIVVQGEGIPRGKGSLEITANVVFPSPKCVVPKEVKNELAELLDILEKQ